MMENQGIVGGADRAVANDIPRQSVCSLCETVESFCPL
jgi:hypothetical protein